MHRAKLSTHGTDFKIKSYTEKSRGVCCPEGHPFPVSEDIKEQTQHKPERSVFPPPPPSDQAQARTAER